MIFPYGYLRKMRVKKEEWGKRARMFLFCEIKCKSEPSLLNIYNVPSDVLSMLYYH